MAAGCRSLSTVGAAYVTQSSRRRNRTSSLSRTIGWQSFLGCWIIQMIEGMGRRARHVNLSIKRNAHGERLRVACIARHLHEQKLAAVKDEPWDVMRKLLGIPRRKSLRKVTAEAIQASDRKERRKEVLPRHLIRVVAPSAAVFNPLDAGQSRCPDGGVDLWRLGRCPHGLRITEPIFRQCWNSLQHNEVGGPCSSWIVALFLS